MKQSLLITKSISELPLLQAFCDEREIHCLAQPFIRFSPVKAEIPENRSPLFFGSKRAVDFFLQQSEIPAGCEIACIGPGTQMHLQNLGYTVHFTGTQAGDPEAVAEELKSWLGTRTLYSIQSQQSNRSIAKWLPEGQVKEIVVYETIPVSFKITENVHWLIFTSPSNLEGYLLENSVPAGSKIIAWGKTTEKALRLFHLKADFVLQKASEEELVSILKTVI